MRQSLLITLTVLLVAAGAFILAGGDGFLLQLPTASAQVLIVPHPWTAVGSSGTVDETALPYFGFTNASAGFKPTAWINPLEFRYNVTNTFDNNANPNMPGWTRLELGATAPATSTVDAALYRVYRCTGAQSIVCQVRVAQTDAGICRYCTFPAGSVDFGNYLYYVRVAVDRNTAAENPQVHTLRIY
jgi:hypothetical protein